MIHTEISSKTFDEYQMDGKELSTVLAMLKTIANTEKITAVKHARTFFGLGLWQSKVLIEGLLNAKDLTTDCILRSAEGENIGTLKYNPIGTVAILLVRFK